MRRGILIAALIALFSPFLMGGSCNQSVVRDTTVYKTELTFWEQASMQTAEALRDLIAEYCTCDGVAFTNEMCEKAAKKVLVVETRVPYHKEMALYNASLTDERPPKDPPVVPETWTLCPEVCPEECPEEDGDHSSIDDLTPEEMTMFLGLINEPWGLPATRVARIIW